MVLSIYSLFENNWGWWPGLLRDNHDSYGSRWLMSGQVVSLDHQWLSTVFLACWYFTFVVGHVVEKSWKLDSRGFKFGLNHYLASRFTSVSLFPFFLSHLWHGDHDIYFNCLKRPFLMSNQPAKSKCIDKSIKGSSLNILSVILIF